MERLNKDAKRYLRQIRSWLPCAGKLKRSMLESIRLDILTFLDENPNADYQVMVARFGSPQQIASSYVDEAATADLLRGLRMKRIIVTITLVTAFVVVSVWAGVVTYAYLDYSDGANGYAAISEVVEVNQ